MPTLGPSPERLIKPEVETMLTCELPVVRMPICTSELAPASTTPAMVMLPLVVLIEPVDNTMPSFRLEDPRINTEPAPVLKV